MILRVCDILTFIERVKGKKVLCFGAGRCGEDVCRSFPEYHLEKVYAAFTDSNPKLWGQMKVLNLVHLRREVVPIVSLEDWRASLGRDTVILITAAMVDEIIEQLESYPETENVDCYVALWFEAFERDRLSYEVTKPPEGWRMNPVQQISKVIHFIWIGDNPIPPMNQKCVESWRKLCPDYEIKFWNEKSYNFLKHPYTRAACEAKKWSLATDYARLDIIYKHGGIYLDCDVELLKPLDELLYNTAYAGIDINGEMNTGVGFGSVKGFPLIKEMRDEYDTAEHTLSDGSFNTKEWCNHFQGRTLLRHGFCLNGAFQVVDGMAIYPAEFFSPWRFETAKLRVTENSYSIHHYDASWFDKKGKNEISRRLQLMRIALRNEEKFI
jgi:hypothetical protein